jgi:hypothetical protein
MGKRYLFVVVIRSSAEELRYFRECHKFAVEIKKFPSIWPNYFVSRAKNIR